MTTADSKDTKDSKDSKDFVLSLRISADLLKEIDAAAQKEKIQRSDYIRKAISDEFTLPTTLRRSQPNLVTHEMLKFSLECMDELDIDRYAFLSLQNAREFLKQYLAHSAETSVAKKYTKNNKTMITGLMVYLISGILGPTAQQSPQSPQWFQQIRAVWEGNTIIITGMHMWGEKFSKFIYYYFRHFFDLFKFREVLDNIMIKDDRLKLGFTGDTDAAVDLAVLIK